MAEAVNSEVQTETAPPPAAEVKSGSTKSQATADSDFVEMIMSPPVPPGFV